jgi:hypothetical protein
MKQKITNPEKDAELGTEDKPFENSVSHSAEEIDAPNIYWLAYSYPFMPMMDFSFIVDEIKKIVKRWIVNIRKHSNFYK